MENATKALLIAGAVLIAILLIAMGVRILSSTSGTVDSAQTVMDATSKTMVMNQFIPYVGTSVPSNKVVEFLSKVAAYNATASENQKVFIKCWGGSYYFADTENAKIYNAISIIQNDYQSCSWRIVNQTGETDYRDYPIAFEIYHN